MSQTYGFPAGKIASKPQLSGVATIASKLARTTSPLKARNPNNSAKKGRASSYHCGNYSHLYAQCPQHIKGLSGKQSIHDDDIEEEVYVPDEEMILKAEHTLTEEQLENDDRPLYVLHLVLTTRTEQTDED